jgi:very-short-patch-repair endonuclease
LPGWAERVAAQCTAAEYAAFERQLDLVPPPAPVPVDAKAQLRREQARANRDKHEVPFLIQVRTLKLPEPIRNYRFAAEAVGWSLDGNNRKTDGKLRARLLREGFGDWKMDFAWPELRIAVEIEGAPGKGAHTTARGFTKDCVKYGEAIAMDWTLLRFTGGQVHSGYAINLTYRIFRNRGLIRPEVDEP